MIETRWDALGLLVGAFVLPFLAGVGLGLGLRLAGVA